MSRKILIPLGSTAVLGTAIYALTLFDFNFVKKKEKDFTFKEKIEPNPEDTISLSEIEEEDAATAENITTLPSPENTDPKTEQLEIKPQSPKPVESGIKKEKTIREIWSENKNNKEASPSQGIKSTNLIRDYSLRLVNKCFPGTIWILDYEIPENNSDYPTKFFFGTSAQVVSQISFNSGQNTYKQTLPTSGSCQISDSKIIGETDINYGGADHFRTYLWKTNEHGSLEVSANDSNNVETWLDEPTHQPPYFYYQIKEMKLAYIATDFAGNSKDNWGNQKNNEKEYMADFAVIEIDFKDQKIAKRMTRDFHRKHHHQKETNHKTINFFEKSLMEKGNKELYDSSMDIYIAGYSESGLKGRSTGNFNLDKRQASKLTYSNSHHMINHNDNGEIIGHADASYSSNSIKGYDQRQLRGVEIVIEHDSLGNGSLGSLVTDSEGNAIGVKSKYESQGVSTVTAFRSKKITSNGKTIIPEYDLIKGIDGNSQVKSYKDSIQTANKKTYLSEKYKWGSRK